MALIPRKLNIFFSRPSTSICNLIFNYFSLFSNLCADLIVNRLFGWTSPQTKPAYNTVWNKYWNLMKRTFNKIFFDLFKKIYCLLPVRRLKSAIYLPASSSWLKHSCTSMMRDYFYQSRIVAAMSLMHNAQQRTAFSREISENRIILLIFCQFCQLQLTSDSSCRRR